MPLLSSVLTGAFIGARRLLLKPMISSFRRCLGLLDLGARAREQLCLHTSARDGRVRMRVIARLDFRPVFKKQHVHTCSNRTMCRTGLDRRMEPTLWRTLSSGEREEPDATYERPRYAVRTTRSRSWSFLD